MNRRLFLASTASIAFFPVGANAEPAAAFAAPPAGYAGPWRVWGPRDNADTGRHHWVAETVPTFDGPFRQVRPHALEWWDGEAWIGTD